MPEISRFFGIVIAIYYKEHGVPHFHAKYSGQTGVFSIVDLKLIEGSLPKRVVALVLEWAFEHRSELLENWQRQSRLWSRRYRMHFVKDVKYLSEYKLMLTFEDGSLRQVDLAPHLDGEVFEPLKEPSNFKSVHLNSDLDTIVWNNGADMSPDFLFEIGVPVAESVPAA